MKSIATIALLSFAAIAPMPFVAAQPTTIDQHNLDMNKAIWEGANNMNYIFTYSETYNGWEDESLPWRTQVSSDQYPQQKKTVDKYNMPRLTGPSVEDMFSFIQDAITGNAAYFKVYYDPVLGYPRRFITMQGPNLLIRNIFALEINAYSPKVELSVNRQKWEQASFDNYNFELTQITNDLFTQWPLKIEVRNNAITSVKDSNGNYVNDKAVYTMNGFFDMIQKKLDDNAPFVDIEYTRDGFPYNIFLVTNNVDRVLEYKISGFDSHVAVPMGRRPGGKHLRH